MNHTLTKERIARESEFFLRWLYHFEMPYPQDDQDNDGPKKGASAFFSSDDITERFTAEEFKEIAKRVISASSLTGYRTSIISASQYVLGQYAKLQ